MELTRLTGGFRGTLRFDKEPGLNPITSNDTLRELAFTIEILGLIMAGISGHGHFAAYHERGLVRKMRLIFGPTSTYVHTCGQAQTQLFSCPNARAYCTGSIYGAKGHEGI